MSIVSVALEVLEGKTEMSHSDLINAVCNLTGNSYESVRGTIIKRDCKLFDSGEWHYQDGCVRSGGREAIVVDYTAPEKLANWRAVREHLPKEIPSMVTLGGINGTDIRVFLPDDVISYDYDPRVLRQLKRNIPWVHTRHGDIMLHNEPATVLNLDLVGYMCGTRFEDFRRATSVGHEYIVITIQGQVGGFRNSGEWVNKAMKKYRRYKDKNLAALKDAMRGYSLLLNRFYRREKGARQMRTTVWRAN
jgi:hypothetical protein